MKKLMIAAAIVCAAAFAQAATYNWTASAGWISPDDDVGLAGKQVYFFNANDISKSALLADLTMANIESYALKLDNNSITAATGDDGDFYVTGKAGSYVFDGGKGDVANAYALIVDSAGGNDYAYAIDTSVTISDAHVSGSALAFNFADTVTGATGGAGWTQIGSPGPLPIPEPTSGLLMLLGVAGLALRRKRA